MATPIIDLSSTPRLALPPDSRMGLNHVWVTNTNAAAAYLNIWAITDTTDDTPTPTIASLTDRILIAAGFCGLVYLGFGPNPAIAISASTGTDGTEAPVANLAVSLRWALPES